MIHCGVIGQDLKQMAKIKSLKLRLLSGRRKTLRSVTIHFMVASSGKWVSLSRSYSPRHHPGYALWTRPSCSSKTTSKISASATMNRSKPRNSKTKRRLNSPLKGNLRKGTLRRAASLLKIKAIKLRQYRQVMILVQMLLVQLLPRIKSSPWRRQMFSLQRIYKRTMSFRRGTM